MLSSTIPPTITSCLFVVQLCVRGSDILRRGKEAIEICECGGVEDESGNGRREGDLIF